jgi:hypothetical protein
MKKAAIVVIALVFVLAGIGYFVASPFLALNNIRQGFQVRDAEKVAQHVDFPALRQSLKEQIGAAALANAATSDDTPLGNAGAALASGFIGQMIDSFVTPSGLAQFMEAQAKQSTSDADTDMNIDPQAMLAEASYGFESLSTFAVRIPDKETGQDVRLVLTRSGFNWKLSDVVLPAGRLKQVP